MIAGWDSREGGLRALFVLASATLLLIGLSGLLYVPSIAVFLLAASHRDHHARTSLGVRRHAR